MVAAATERTGRGASFKFACHAEAGEGGCLKSVFEKNLNSDDHFEHPFAFYRNERQTTKPKPTQTKGTTIL
jgi:hypothetical protein